MRKVDKETFENFIHNGPFSILYEHKIRFSTPARTNYYTKPGNPRSLVAYFYDAIDFAPGKIYEEEYFISEETDA